MLTRIEAGEGNDLADIGELAHVAEFASSLAASRGQCRQWYQASRDVLLEVRMAVDMVLDGLLDLLDLVRQEIDLLLQFWP